jgi:hypothetical protein
MCRNRWLWRLKSTARRLGIRRMELPDRAKPSIFSRGCHFPTVTIPLRHFRLRYTTRKCGPQAEVSKPLEISRHGDLMLDVGLADALIQSVLIRTLYGVPVPPERRFRLEILAHPTLAQQNLTVHIPANQYKLQIIPNLAPLDQQQRHHRLFVTMNGHLVSRGTPTPAPDDPLPLNALVFEVGLQPGTSVIAITLVSALPKGQKLPNGSDCELERITINAHLSKLSTS